MSIIEETSTNYENWKILSQECSEVYATNIIEGQWSLVISNKITKARELLLAKEKIAVLEAKNYDLSNTPTRRFRKK